MWGCGTASVEARDRRGSASDEARSVVGGAPCDWTWRSGFALATLRSDTGHERGVSVLKLSMCACTFTIPTIHKCRADSELSVPAQRPSRHSPSIGENREI